MKMVMVCFVALVVGLFATGFERIVWMFSGSALVAVVPKKLYQQVAEINCDELSIEVKRDTDGVMRYRCGSYWLLSHGNRSIELTNAWPEIRRMQRSGAGLP
jgi:hypothetical protein